MQLVKYSEKFKNEWDDFVLNHSKNGTIFQTQAFLSYHPENRFIDKSLLIYDNKTLKAIFPAVDIENKIISHQGATYGGLVVHSRNKLSETQIYYQLIEEHFKQYDALIFKKQEYIFDGYPSGELEFVAQSRAYDIQSIELSTCLDLSHSEFSKLRKRCYAKCKNTIEIKFDDHNYEAFYDVLSHNLKTKHQSTATHSLDEMMKLKAILPNHYYLVSAYLDNELVAGIWLVVANNITLHTFYIAQNYDFADTQAITCIIDNIIVYGKKNHFNYLNFGISTEDQGQVINEGLFRFKESFGGFGVNRYTYKKVFK